MKPVTLFIIACSIRLVAACPVALAQTTFTKITTGPVVSDAATSFSAAWVDFDNDGDLDLFVSNADGANLLYRNDGQGVFTKITNSPIVNVGAGSFGTSWADLDNDGRIDLFIARNGAQGLLFRQQADGTFTKSTLPLSQSFGAAWADYDNDGFVDLLVADEGQSILWHNDGQGGLVALRNTSIDASVDAIAWADYDNDGDMDVFIVEGGFTGGGNSRLYRNDGKGVFTRITSGPLVERSTLATSAAWGDYDNDGFLDLFLARSGSGSGQGVPAFLFHNNANGTFTQVEQSPFTNDVGVAQVCVWGDYDNDGWLDLFVTETSGGKNRLYHNNRDGTFSRVLSGPIAEDVGNCSGAAWGDYDSDGFLDLFVATSVASGPQPNDYLYHNDGNSNAWITVKCVGTGSNRAAIGAKLRVKATIGGKTFWQFRELNTGDGWAGNPLEAHFGLGNATNIETLRIEWPSGTVQEFQNVNAGQYITVTEPPRLLGEMRNRAAQFTLQGGRNLQYDLEVSSDLKAWSILGKITITNLDGTALITDTNAPDSDRRFYRAAPYTWPH